jgi:hypothetical protein
MTETVPVGCTRDLYIVVRHYIRWLLQLARCDGNKPRGWGATEGCIRIRHPHNVPQLSEQCSGLADSNSCVQRFPCRSDQTLRLLGNFAHGIGRIQITVKSY